MHKLRSFIDAVERLGVANALLWALDRILCISSRNRWQIHRYRFVAQPVAVSDLSSAPRTTSIVIRRVYAGDLLVRQFPRPPEVIAQRYRMGAMCLAAEKQGTFVGFLWIKESQYPEDEVRCIYVLEPAGAAVWDFDVHIEPHFRLGRTFARLWDAANAWLREHDYRWSMSRISAFNPESLAAHRRLGMRALGSATFLRMGRAQIALLDQAPFVHVGWRDDQTPILRFTPPVDVISRTTT